MSSNSEYYIVNPDNYGSNPEYASEQYKKMNETIQKRANAVKTGCFPAEYNAETNKYYCPECKNVETGTSRHIGHQTSCIYHGINYCQQKPSQPLNLPPINPSQNSQSLILPTINPSQNSQLLNLPPINPSSQNSCVKRRKLGGTQKRKRAKRNQKKKTRRYRRKSVRRNSN